MIYCAKGNRHSVVKGTAYMKKHITILLLLAMLAPMIASCGKPAETETQPVDTVAAETETVETELTDSLPEKDFGGANYRVLTAAEQWQKFYNSEQNGEIINDAVYKRNLTVEERFNVKLDYKVFNGYTAGMADVKNALSGSVMSGGNDYDMMVGSSSYVIGLMADKLLTNLDEAVYVDLKAPWWFQYVNDSIRIVNKQYFGAGSLNMLNYAWAIVMYFNKNVAENYQVGDLYTCVQEGNWTWDTFSQMCETVLTDTDGNQKYDWNDTVGIYSTDDYFSFFLNSFEYEDATHNPDGTVTINPISDKLISVNEMLFSMMNSDLYLNGYLHPECKNADYSPMIHSFATDHALFMYHRLEFTDTEILRNMDGYGILPSPKYDVQQTNYMTGVVSEVSGIPAVVPDLEMSAIILEAMQFETWKSVRPAYYDIALKSKYTQDAVSGQMLDIIFGNLTASFPYMYSRITGGFPGGNLGLTENYASWFASNQPKWQNALDALIKTMQED